MEANKITISGKTYDLNYVGKKKKTNPRRKLIIEYIQSKPAGELISTTEFQRVGQFTTASNAYTFIQRMVRDGVISKYAGERPKTSYYGVTGAIRVHKPKEEGGQTQTPDLNLFIENMNKLGVRFTITITNEK